MSIKCE